MQQPFMAYENDTDGYSIGTLSIINGLESIRIEGTIQITKDKEGLEAARKLKRVVDAAIEVLKRDRNLPNSLGH
jgi:hypothetical protein